MKKARKYIVVGSYNSDTDLKHVCSGHNYVTNAWKASKKAHYNLGGCDGSNLLCKVMERYAPIASLKAKAITEDRYQQHDIYIHGGYVYIGCDYWANHTVTLR